MCDKISLSVINSLQSNFICRTKRLSWVDWGALSSDQDNWDTVTIVAVQGVFASSWYPGGRCLDRRLALSFPFLSIDTLGVLYTDGGFRAVSTAVFHNVFEAYI